MGPQQGIFTTYVSTLIAMDPQQGIFTSYLSHPVVLSVHLYPKICLFIPFTTDRLVYLKHITFMPLAYHSTRDFNAFSSPEVLKTNGYPFIH